MVFQQTFMFVTFCATSSHQHVDDLLLVGLLRGVAQNGGPGKWRTKFKYYLWILLRYNQNAARLL